ncbi:MAG: YceI family protein, partial [Anaerolineales bacterium]|nr:YceI family protein [Anaerolineales bacterium]
EPETEGTEGYPVAPAAPQTASGYPEAPVVADTAVDAYPATSPETATTASIRTFAIVPAESTARYVVAETFLDGAQERLGIAAGLVDTIGETQVVDGSLSLDFSQSPIALQSGSFTVDISTLQSDQSMRDNTLRDRWLQSGTYPIATFVATGIENFPADYAEGTEASFQLVGDITIRDTTQPATWDVTATLADGKITGTAVTNLTMTAFGFDPPSFGGVFTVEDAFEAQIDFTAQEQ